MPFKKFFHPSEKSEDGLTQSAREAIVDVLHYVMYADKHISAREDQFIEEAARKLNWDPKISYEYYEGKSTGAVSRALSTNAAGESFLESLKMRLPRKADRNLALSLAEELSRTDGKNAEETTSIAKLKSAFGS
ncbi:MAG: hypothetical protein ABIR80_03735 [Opitutaceae bacterium]